MNEQHEQFETLLTKYVEGAVSDAERAQMESHLASCAGCRTAYETDKKTRDALLRETKAFAEGYDYGRLEADLARELRSGVSAIRWVAALTILFGLLTIVLCWRPLASQPEAWTATLPLTLGSLASLYGIRRKQARFAAIARAAESAQGGYRDLERARVEINVREFRRAGRFGLAVALALPMILGLFIFIERIRLKDAFPAAEVQVSLNGLPPSVILISIVVLFVPVSVYCLWKARRLESTMNQETPY